MHPVAFKLGSFTIYWYGLMTVIAYAVVLVSMKYTRRYEDLDPDTALDCSIYAIIGGVLGARLLYTMINFSDYIQRPLEIIKIREGGLSWYGALMGGALAIFILSRVRKKSFPRLIDFTAVHGVIALAVGRIGCFLNGCCYGRVTQVPWGVEFTGAQLEGIRHPTQLYETILLVAAFIILLRWWPHKKFDGEMTLGAFFFNGLSRFIMEFFRYNTPDQYPGGGMLSLAQYFAILLILIFPVIIIANRRKASAGENHTENGITKDDCTGEAGNISKEQMDVTD